MVISLMAKNKVFPLRIPEELRTAVEKRAEERLRSINNEVVILLKLGLVNDTDESKALNSAKKLISQEKEAK